MTFGSFSDSLLVAGMSQIMEVQIDSSSTFAGMHEAVVHCHFGDREDWPSYA
jgi:hypothetical protein